MNGIASEMNRGPSETGLWSEQDGLGERVGPNHMNTKEHLSCTRYDFSVLFQGNTHTLHMYVYTSVQ